MRGPPRLSFLHGLAWASCEDSKGTQDSRSLSCTPRPEHIWAPLPCPGLFASAPPPSQKRVRTVPPIPCPAGPQGPGPPSLIARRFPPFVPPRAPLALRAGGHSGRGAPRLPGPGAESCESPQLPNGAGWPGWGFYTRHILSVLGEARPAPPQYPLPCPLPSRVRVSHPTPVSRPAGQPRPETARDPAAQSGPTPTSLPWVKAPPRLSRGPLRAQILSFSFYFLSAT